MDGARLVMGDNMTEILEYDRGGYPVRTVEARLSSFMNMAADCHWHEDLEFTTILDGGMSYFVNDRSYRLSAGMGIFVNANRLHYGYAERGGGAYSDCLFHCLVFHPSLLACSPRVEKAYIDPLLYGDGPDALVFTPDTRAGRGILSALRGIRKTAGEKGPYYELRLQSAAFGLLRRLLEHTPPADAAAAGRRGALTNSLKAMAAFIHGHYAEKITLQEIAAAGAVCRSKCCALFRENLHQSVFEYVQRCRVRAAGALLRDPRLSVSEVAAACGFSGAGFFSRTFRALTGASPREWRKREEPAARP